MRNREKQRELRRTVGKEEKIDRFNYYGNQDLTPYEAVKNMIRKGESAADFHEQKRTA